MNGRPHALIGAAVPLGALATGTPVLPTLVLCGISAGSALLPDLDHPTSTATKALSGAAHRVVHLASRAVRVPTSTRADLRSAAWQRQHLRDPDHRGLTHTLLAAAAFGVVMAALCSQPVGVCLAVLVSGWICQHLVRHAMTPVLMACFGAVAALAMFLPVHPLAVGLAAAGGWLSHVIADGCTTAGVPLAWPLKIRGKRWYRVRLLGSTLKSGQRLEWVAGFAVASVFVVCWGFLAR